MRILYHIPVTQEHLDDGQSATWQNPAGNMAVIPHEERVLSKAALALSALRANPWPQCTPASATPPLCWTTVRSLTTTDAMTASY